MNEKPKNLYLVQSGSGRRFYAWAASGDQAKRIFCREYGVRPSDGWLGVSALRARKLKPEEVKAWEERAEMNRDTAAFIEGMMGICVRACAEKGEEE